MLNKDVAGIDEVAAALGRPADWLRRNWLRIHERDGFPRKHPTGWTWPRAAVSAWLRAGCSGTARDFLPANENQIEDPDAIWRAALDDRYGGNH